MSDAAAVGLMLADHQQCLGDMVVLDEDGKIVKLIKLGLSEGPRSARPLNPAVQRDLTAEAK